jgi:hypothetical protein
MIELNKAGLGLVKKHQGFRATIYVCPAAKLTIDYLILAFFSTGIHKVHLIVWPPFHEGSYHELLVILRFILI